MPIYSAMRNGSYKKLLENKTTLDYHVQSLEEILPNLNGN